MLEIAFIGRAVGGEETRVQNRMHVIAIKQSTLLGLYARIQLVSNFLRSSEF